MEKLNRTPIIIISVVFAIGLWLTVNLGFEYTTTKNIPVIIQNLSDDVALGRTPPEYVRARIRGEGWKLLGLKIGGDTKYIVDVHNTKTPVTIRTTADLSERLRMPGGLDIAELYPPQFTLEIETKREKIVPIQPVYDITFRDGFNRVGPITLSPDSVTIYGAESIIRATDSWKTEPLVLRDVREPVRKTILLSDSLSKIVSLAVESCEVYFDVQPIAEKSITGLRVTVEGIPANREVIIIPPRIDLIIRGGINQLAAIEEENFTAQVHYREILADTSGTIIPRIYGPDDVRIVQRSPERLQYVIRRTQ